MAPVLHRIYAGLLVLVTAPVGVGFFGYSWGLRI